MRKAMIIVFGVVVAGAARTEPYQRPLAEFTYFAESMHSASGELVWFDNAVVMGRLHANDTIAIRGGRFDRVTASGPIIREANPEFSEAYREHRESINFGVSLRTLEAGARHIWTHNGELTTWIKMQGEQGIDVFQYPLGGERDDSLVYHMAPPRWSALYVDGETEIEGVLDGQLTILSTGNIWLLDDVLYEGADPASGDFDEASMTSKLGLIAEQNIIIADNPKNGSNDGYNEQRNNPDRHSIVVDGGLCALGGSLSFEHQNKEGDVYQGSTPDERGYVLLKGCILQRFAGAMHNSNHDGTGYNVQFSYDGRFEYNAPFYSNNRGFSEPRYDRLILEKDYYLIGDTSIGTLVIAAGCEIVVTAYGFEVTDSLIMNGTVDEPIIFSKGYGDAIRIGGAGVVYSRVNNVISPESVNWTFKEGRHCINNSTFNGEMTIGGDVEIDSCSFSERVKLVHAGEVTVTRSLFEGGVLATIVNGTATLRNCTMVNSRRAGVETQQTEPFNLVNCIVANNRWGVLSSGLHDPVVRYCDVTDNLVSDYVDCAPGEGSFSEAPRFVNERTKDYHLTGNSPCIDRGDPASLRDPDGTRADVGAFYFDHVLVMADCGLQIAEWGLNAAPNPFNNRTTLTFEIPQQGDARIVVYDLSGRVQTVLLDRKVETGRSTLAIDASCWPAGEYLATLQVGKESRSVKIVKLN